MRSPKSLSHYKPCFIRVAGDIGKGYGLIAMILILNFWIKNPFPLTIRLHPFISTPLLLVSCFFMGLAIHFLFLFMHEGAHLNLHPDGKWNDRLTNLLISYWFLQEVGNYRRVHMDHHRFYGTTRDPENSYFKPLTSKEILLSLTGVKAIEAVGNWNQATGTQIPVFKLLLFFGAYQGLVLVVFFRFSDLVHYIWLWLIPYFCLFPFFAYTRQVLEHRKYGSSDRIFDRKDQGEFTRIFRKSWLASLFGGAGFRLHWVHHHYPTVSYTALERLFDDLSIAEPETVQMVPVDSYGKTFIRLLGEGSMKA